MIAIRYRYVLLMGVYAMVVFVSAQITFSRDWTGGKRGTSQLGLDCAHFTKLCRHFLHEIQRAMTKEISAKHHHKEKQYYDEDKYDDD